MVLRRFFVDIEDLLSSYIFIFLCNVIYSFSMFYHLKAIQKSDFNSRKKFCFWLIKMRSIEVMDRVGLCTI